MCSSDLQVKIAPNKLCLFSENQKLKATSELNKLKLEDEIVFSLLSNLEQDEDFPLEFVASFNLTNTITHLNLPTIIINELQFENSFSKEIEQIQNNIEKTFKSKKLIEILKNSPNLGNLDNFLKKNEKLLAFFTPAKTFSADILAKLKTKTINFNTAKFESFLLNLNKMYPTLKPYLNKKIYLCLSSQTTLNLVKTILEKQSIPHTTNKNAKGIILTELNIPYNICFEDSEVFYLGSTNFAHKKSTTASSKSSVKYLPKAGEYVVHSIHGIGKCEGVVSMKVEGVDKEFFRLTYRGGNLYVPCESAESLSLYMADGENVKLNQLGGKEFTNLKNKAQKAIEDMSKELIELYAKRKYSKGFKYNEDDYIYTQF